MLESCSPKFTSTIMQMNNPANLKNSCKWDSLATANITLYYYSGLSRKTVSNLLQKQIQGQDTLLNIMNISKPDSDSKIYFWMFKSQKDKYKYTQVSSNAHSIQDYNSIYCTYNNATSWHELSHILSQKYWGLIPKTSTYYTLVNEGWAYLADENNFFKFSYYKKAKELMNKNPGLDLSLVVSNGKQYSRLVQEKSLLSAAFLKYLIQKYGIDSFAEFWKQLSSNDSAFQLIYGESFDALEDDFKVFLANWELK